MNSKAETSSPPSLSHSKRSLVRSLSRRKKRKEHALFLAEGARLLGDLSNVPGRIEFIYTDVKGLSLIPNTLTDCPIFFVDEKNTSLFVTENPQGIGAVVRMKEAVEVSDLLKLDSPILYLDQLADPGNVGTILRTADWFGIEAVFFGKGSVDPWNPKVVRASMGAIFRLNIVENLVPDDIVALQRSCYLLDTDASASLGKAELDRHGLYVVGNEAHGLSEGWKGKGKGLSIPGKGQGDSLNAAMATTILCWELSRLNKSA